MTSHGFAHISIDSVAVRDLERTGTKQRKQISPFPYRSHRPYCRAATFHPPLCRNSCTGALGSTILDVELNGVAGYVNAYIPPVVDGNAEGSAAPPPVGNLMITRCFDGSPALAIIPGSITIMDKPLGQGLGFGVWGLWGVGFGVWVVVSTHSLFLYLKHPHLVNCVVRVRLVRTIAGGWLPDCRPCLTSMPPVQTPRRIPSREHQAICRQPCAEMVDAAVGSSV